MSFKKIDVTNVCVMNVTGNRQISIYMVICTDIRKNIFVLRNFLPSLLHICHPFSTPFGTSFERGTMTQGLKGIQSLSELQHAMTLQRQLPCERAACIRTFTTIKSD